MQVELNPVWVGYARAGLDINEENIEFRNVKEDVFFRFTDYGTSKKISVVCPMI